MSVLGAVLVDGPLNLPAALLMTMGWPMPAIPHSKLTRLREDKDHQLQSKDQEIASLRQQLDLLRRGPDCRSGSTSLVKVRQAVCVPSFCC
jgi:hypothetical protein